MARIRAFIVCMSCACAASAQAQTAQPEQKDSRAGLIVGQVVDAGSARPVSAAIVTLNRGDAAAPPPNLITPSGVPPLPRVMTGSDGQFAFRALPQGRYSVTALKPGYVSGAYGRRRPDGAAQPITLEDGEKLGDITIRIWKQATISGSVVDEAGEPMIGTPVRALRRTYVAGRPRFVPVLGSPVTPFGVATDDRGVYRLSGLTPGDYAVLVESMQASVPLSTLQAYRDPGTMPSAQMSQIFQIRGPTSLPGSSPAAIQVGNTAWSLPRASLTPPQPAEGRTFVYQTTYYPAATTLAGATLVRIGSGDERADIDFQLRPVPASRVSGALAGDPAAVAHVPIWLNPPDSQESGVGVDSAAATLSDANGAFVFPAVPAGQYVLRALKQPPRPSSPSATTMIQAGPGVVFSTVMSGPDAAAPVPAEPSMYATTPVVVGRRDIGGLTVPLQAGPRVSGRLDFDGTAPRPTPEELERIAVGLESAVTGGGSGLPSGRADRSGAFTTYSVPAGRYLMRVSGIPRGWTFRAATYNGRDVSEAALDLEGADATGVVISFTDRPTELSGTVHASDGRSDADATVLIFPSDPQAWTSLAQQRRFRTLRTTKMGGFTTAGLPAGSYYAVAVPDEAIGDWLEPTVLEALARGATEIRLDDGEKKSQDLRTREIR